MDLDELQQPTHIVSPGEGHEHTHTFIFLHGREDANDRCARSLLGKEASRLREQPDQKRTLATIFPTIKWVFPAAPKLYCPCIDGDSVQWFDDSVYYSGSFQESRLKICVDIVLDLVRSEEAHVRRDRIFVGGFAQGFTVVTAAFVADGLHGVAGIIGLSSWMPYGTADDLRELVAEESTAAEAGAQHPPTHIMLCHCEDDDIVDIEGSFYLMDELCRFGNTLVEHHEYPVGGHDLSWPNGVDDIVAFLQMRGLGQRSEGQAPRPPRLNGVVDSPRLNGVIDNDGNP